MICTKCKRQLPNTAEYQFCPYCGSKIAFPEKNAEIPAEKSSEAPSEPQKEQPSSSFRLTDLGKVKDLGPVRHVLYLPAGIGFGAFAGLLIGSFWKQALLGMGIGMAAGAGIGCVVALIRLMKR